MKETQNTAPVATLAARKIHEAIVDSDAFFGYDGSNEAFYQIYSECVKIECECFPVNQETVAVDEVVEMWFDFQNEIAEGLREVDWALAA